MQCQMRSGVQLDISIAADIGPKQAAYLAEKVPPILCPLSDKQPNHHARWVAPLPLDSIRHSRLLRLQRTIDSTVQLAE